MATIAKSSITLVSISDAYSVSLQPSNITINADPYGNNPKLENAFTIISLYCGDIQVPISSASIVGSSLWEEGSNIHKQDYSLEIVGNSVKLSITSIGNQLSGWREIEVITNAGQKLTARFSYTVVRETTMLDWILEWDKNLTEISGDHVATPNAFIGNKDGDGKLTGVYIGGGENHPYLPGIYGFKGCTPEAFAQGNLGSTEIFHLNENGGMIGGWDISNTGLIKENSVGRLEILSEGTIRYVNLLDATNPFWELKSDGSGSFASGHITWDVSGNATFDGKLKAQSGEIGGWAIGSHSLYNTSILLDSANSFFGLRGPSGLMFINEPLSSSFYDSITRAGGIAIYYTDSTHYGLEGWLQGSPTTIDYNKGTQIFGLGSKNFIASWNIGANALWRGDLVNTAGNFTGKSGDITIGSQGIRGYRWYIDADGEADFMQGRVHLGPSKCEIAGWTIQENRLCTSKAALVNDTNYAGLFLSTNVLGSSEGVALTDKIASSGGIYLITTSNHAELAAYSVGDILLFKLTSSGTNQIASWKFDHKRIYIGASDLIPGSKFTAFSNSLVLSDNGIHAPKWCLLADGSGKLAGGNISWDIDGNVTFANSVKLAWTQITGTEGVMTTATYIDANGIFTGKISANNITAGTISTASIKCEGKWALNTDGSGFLASNNISWLADGTLSVKGHIEADSGVIGGFKITDSGIFSLETNYYTGDVRNGAFSMFSQGSSAFLCFHDDGRWAGIGLNCSPAAGTPTVARFESYYTDSVFPGWNTNIALYLRAENGGHNFAFLGKGNGVLNGYVVGSKLSTYTMTQANTIYQGFIKPSENNRWLIKATASDTGMQLPECSEVASALGLSTSSAWAVEFLIIGDIGSNIFKVYGKYLKKIGTSPNESLPWCKAGDPLLLNANGERINSVNVGSGDSLRLLLVNNPDETKKDANSTVTVNGVSQTIEWSYKYTARILNYAT